MGQIRLGVLPGSKKWQQVVEELSHDARGRNYAEDLSALGLDLPSAPSLFEVTADIRAPNTEHALRRPGADDLAIKPTSASQIGFREPLTGSF